MSDMEQSEQNNKHVTLYNATHHVHITLCNMSSVQWLLQSGQVTQWVLSKLIYGHPSLAARPSPPDQSHVYMASLCVDYIKFSLTNQITLTKLISIFIHHSCLCVWSAQQECPEG